MKKTLPESQKRVEKNTRTSVKARLEDERDERVEHIKRAGRGEIEKRLRELDQEWDIERTLQTNMGLVLSATLVAAATHSRAWTVMSGMVAAFFLQHSLQGWCPPLPIWRKAGVRSAKEIDEERTELELVLEREAQS